MCALNYVCDAFTIRALWGVHCGRDRLSNAMYDVAVCVVGGVADGGVVVVWVGIVVGVGYDGGVATEDCVVVVVMVVTGVLYMSMSVMALWLAVASSPLLLIMLWVVALLVMVMGRRVCSWCCRGG